MLPEIKIGHLYDLLLIDLAKKGGFHEEGKLIQESKKLYVEKVKLPKLKTSTLKLI